MSATSAIARVSWARRHSAWVTQVGHVWLAWFLVRGALTSESLLDALCWSIAAFVVVHEFAALRRRNRILTTQLLSGRWLRRFDDAYFDAVQRALGSLTLEERARFDQALRGTRRGADTDSEGREGATTPQGRIPRS